MFAPRSRLRAASRTYRRKLRPSRAQHCLPEERPERQHWLDDVAFHERRDAWRSRHEVIARHRHRQKSPAAVQADAPERSGADPVNRTRWTLKCVEDAFTGFFGQAKYRVGGAGFPRFAPRSRRCTFELLVILGPLVLPIGRRSRAWIVRPRSNGTGRCARMQARSARPSRRSRRRRFLRQTFDSTSAVPNTARARLVAFVRYKAVSAGGRMAQPAARRSCGACVRCGVYAVEPPTQDWHSSACCVGRPRDVTAGRIVRGGLAASAATGEAVPWNIHVDGRAVRRPKTLRAACRRRRGRVTRVCRASMTKNRLVRIACTTHAATERAYRG